MSRPSREPNLQLQTLIDEAGFSHKGLARRVNELGRPRGCQACHMITARLFAGLEASIRGSLYRYFSQKCFR